MIDLSGITFELVDRRHTASLDVAVFAGARSLKAVAYDYAADRLGSAVAEIR